MKLLVLTPEKTLFNGDVESIHVPGSIGPMEILKDHASILTGLVPGSLIFRVQKKEKAYFLSGGFLEFNSNQAVILADAAESIDELDINRATEAKKRALERLQNKTSLDTARPGPDADRAQRALSRAQGREKFYRSYRI